VVVAVVLLVLFLLLLLLLPALWHSLNYRIGSRTCMSHVGTSGPSSALQSRLTLDLGGVCDANQLSSVARTCSTRQGIVCRRTPRHIIFSPPLTPEHKRGCAAVRGCVKQLQQQHGYQYSALPMQL